MKVLKFIFLLLTLIQVSCKKASVIDSELESMQVEMSTFKKIDTTYSNKKITGLKLFEDNSNYTNVEFYESGKKKFIHRVSNGQCHGKYIDWFENGKVQWERSYVNGNQIALSKHYDEKGRLKQVDDNNKDDKNSWTIFEYFDNNQMKLKRSMNQYIEYYRNGNIKCQFDIENEKQFMKLYNEDAKLVFSGIYNSKLHMTFDKFGKPFTGKIKTKFLNGKISELKELKDGLSNNLTMTFHPTGNPKYKGKYNNGKPIGIHTYTDDNGKVKSYDDYDKNIHKNWDENGELIR